MKNILRDVIVDQKKFLKREKLVDREIKNIWIESELVVVITGIRRCGKSILLQQIRNKNTQRDYFLNFDDDRLINFSVNDFQKLYEVFVELYGEQDIFYFDEIQNIIGWEHFVKRLYNLGKKVYVTGSNARMLSKELGTLLTGCYISVELTPFTFKEYLLFKGVDCSSNISGTIEKGKISSHFNHYLEDGGFPLYLKTKDRIILKTLYENILYRDILVRYNLSNEKELKVLTQYLLSNIGKIFSLTNLCSISGFKNVTTIKNYIEYLSNTYLIFLVSKFDYSLKKQIYNPKKVYVIDNALSLMVGVRFSLDKGRLLENLVYLELRRKNLGSIYYYSDNLGECDFIIQDQTNIISAYQVCVSLSNPEIVNRECKGLLIALQKFNLEEGWIITNDEEKDIEIDGKQIHVVPIWKWVMNINY